MAKSLRSKHARKMRANKRKKVYGPKELARLKKIVANHDKDPDVEMMDPSLVTVTDAKKIKETVENKQDSMEVEGQGSSKFHTKTLRDENGQYPVWLSKRKKRNLSSRSVKNRKNKNKW